MSDTKRVPVEPTEEMRVAGLRALHALGDRTLVDGRSIVDAVLMAALAAAPPANGRYSQGVCGYSPVVLCDGRPITIDEIVRRLNAPPASAADEDDLSWLMNAAEGGHDNIISCGMARRIVRALDPDALQLAEEPKREMRDSVESIVQAYATAHRAALAAASQSNQPDELARLERKVRNELARAMTKFPTWPTDPIHAAMVIAEESGELMQAVLQACYEPGKPAADNVYDEAIQTAAMCLRFLLSLDGYVFQPGPQHEQVWVKEGE